MHFIPNSLCKCVCVCASVYPTVRISLECVCVCARAFLAKTKTQHKAKRARIVCVCEPHARAFASCVRVCVSLFLPGDLRCTIRRTLKVLMVVQYACIGTFHMHTCTSDSVSRVLSAQSRANVTSGAQSAVPIIRTIYTRVRAVYFGTNVRA